MHSTHDSNREVDLSADDILVAYRHDAHKVFARSHRYKRKEGERGFADDPVPLGADADASALSRPAGEPVITVKNHKSRVRLSLLASDHDDPQDAARLDEDDGAFTELFQTEDAEATHRAWLSSDLAGMFNESVYYPYTSLKYHTLLVAALLANYREGIEFGDLWLVVDQANDLVPHRTVFVGERFALRIDTEPATATGARLGSRPWRSWASTWSRLQHHPFEADTDRFDMVLDAQLRRIWAWSTALQYIEDFERWRALT